MTPVVPQHRGLEPAAVLRFLDGRPSPLRLFTLPCGGSVEPVVTVTLHSAGSQSPVPMFPPGSCLLGAGAQHLQGQTPEASGVT